MRQESPLWAALHRGVLTSGTLNAALGFYEPVAARRLGIPKGFVGHGHLLAAYRNLRLPEYVPPPAAESSALPEAAFSRMAVAAEAALASGPLEDAHSAVDGAKTGHTAGQDEASHFAAAAAALNAVRGAGVRGKKIRGRDGKRDLATGTAGVAAFHTSAAAAAQMAPPSSSVMQLQRETVCAQKAAQGVLQAIVQREPLHCPVTDHAVSRLFLLGFVCMLAYYSLPANRSSACQP